MKTNKKSALNELLSEITPEEQEKTDIKMLLAAKIADALKAKGWNNTILLNKLGKSNPSEITRWLSGTHNFTIDTLIDLQRVLDIQLIDVRNKSASQIFYFSLKTNHYNSWHRFFDKPDSKEDIANKSSEYSYY